jgi:hypothetical protein
MPEANDIEFDQVIRSKLESKEPLADRSNHDFGNSIAIGTGSTNWSISGLSEKDNLTLSRGAVVASELRAVLDLNYGQMLRQKAEARAKEEKK